VVFDRDKHSCRVCDWHGDIEQLDAHHISDRHDFPAGGYVLENGITLCPTCHLQAESWLQGRQTDPKYARDALYGLIGSSFDKAVSAEAKA
jgi:5-methylcytosine-specific restriction endonuclease McrA